MGLFEVVYLGPRHLPNRGDDKLCNPIATSDLNGSVGQVDQDDLDLPSVVRVDGARAVEHRDPFSCREAGTRSHLCLESLRKSKR